MVSQWVFCVIQYLYYRRMLGRHLLFTICPLPPCVSIASKRQKKVADESSVWLGLGGGKGFCRKNAEQSEKTEAVDGRWLCVHCLSTNAQTSTRGKCARLPVQQVKLLLKCQTMHKLRCAMHTSCTKLEIQLFVAFSDHANISLDISSLGFV